MASAQALSCNVPAQIETPRPDGPDAVTPVRLGQIGGFTLALSWSPQYCRAKAERADAAFQCRTSRFGMILHGLWPDGETKDWPQYCRPVALMSEAAIRENLCTTPSVQLLQHEWAKHGSCMSATPEEYFKRATTQYRAVKLPDFASLSRRRVLTAGQLATEVARQNPGMPSTAVRVTTAKGDWLDELWICLDIRFRYQACPVTQGGGVPTSRRIKIWRGGAT